MIARVRKEKSKLLQRGTWDETTVIEYDDLIAMSKKDSEKRHVGRVHSVCCVKNSELPWTP